MYRPLGHLYGNINTFVRLFEITVVEYEIHPVNMAAFELRKVPARILECFGRQVQRSAGIIAGGIGTPMEKLMINRMNETVMGAEMK